MIPCLVALSLVGLAGCLGSNSPGASSAPDDGTSLSFDPLWYEKALTGGDGHDHADFQAHAELSTPNFDILGWDPLITEYGTSPGGVNCGDAAQTQDGRRIGAVQADDGAGIVLSDLTDPAAPVFLGELYLTGTNIYDVAVTNDAEHLAIVTWSADTDRVPMPAWASQIQAGTGALPADAGRAESRNGHGFFIDACGGHHPVTSSVQDPIPRPVSVLLVDIADPASPVIVDQKPIQGLGHGVFTTDIAGQEWVLTITENLMEGARFFTLFEIVQDESLGDRLDPVSVFQDALSPDHVVSAVGHSDGWLDLHPVTGEITGYFVAGTKMLLVDYSDPRLPTLLGSWSDVPEQLAADHNLHSIHTEDFLRGDRHYTFLGPENGPMDETPTGVVWVIDTTDPTQPFEVAAWTLPYDVDWSGASYSPHYLTVVNDTLFVAMYHGGIWAVDVSNIALGTPEAPVLLPSIGAFLPANEPPARPEGSRYSHTAPHIFEVFAFPDGSLATFETNSGVYTFRFDATQPAPSPEPWPIEPVSS